MRDKTEDNSQQTDGLAVSAIYKQIAKEQAPEELNSKILHEATIKARDTGNLALWWLRPAALAATLALSVALVLQVADMDVTKSIPRNLESPAAATQDENIFDAAATAGMEQIREAEAAARANPGLSESPTAPGNQVGPGPTPTRSANEIKGCSADQKSSSVTWWQCIQTLEKRGLTDLAKSELEALFAANPGFDVPDSSHRSN